MALSLAIVASVLSVCLTKAQGAYAQSAQTSLKQSCADATRAFTLRDAGTEGLAVADPAAIGKLRQAALLFYRCAQRESDPYMRDLFIGYYANSLYKVAQTINDSRALALASKAAEPLHRSSFDDVRELVAGINSPPTHAQPRATTVSVASPPSTKHSSAYCNDYSPSIAWALDSLGAALVAASDSGTNDTQVLAVTTARYGSAFKAVEDDFNIVQNNLQSATSALANANASIDQLNTAEKASIVGPFETVSKTIAYTDTYSRLALTYERGINSANRRLAWAHASQAFASGMQNRSYTYSNGNASCYSFTSYSANCNGNSYSTTTYDNSATIAQQNAANALASAQAGRLSYSEADSVLAQGLPVLQQITQAVYSAHASWTNVCTGSN